jgi:hypothetical protein
VHLETVLVVPVVKKYVCYHGHSLMLFPKLIWHSLTCLLRTGILEYYHYTTGMQQKNNTWDSNVVPHRGTIHARRCFTSETGRDAVLSSLYGRSWMIAYVAGINGTTEKSRTACHC